jgi:hypothetical protein
VYLLVKKNILVGAVGKQNKIPEGDEIKQLNG